MIGSRIAIHIVRADDVQVGNVIIDTGMFGMSQTAVVTNVEFVGDDVDIIAVGIGDGGKIEFSTSVGNAIAVVRG